MAEKRSRNYISASDAKKGGSAKTAAPKKGKSATGYRIGAIVLWLLAIACEALAILLLNGTLYVEMDMTTLFLIALGVDLVLVIIGSQLWKHGNRIDPISEKKKLKFWLWNNMGVIAAVIAFFPFVVMLLKDKDLDAKTKKLVSVVAIIALLIAGAVSYDWNPVSEESKAATIAEVGDDTVYWTRFGKSYHLSDECGSLSRSKDIFYGTIEEAFDANRADPCDHCALRSVDE